MEIPAKLSTETLQLNVSWHAAQFFYLLAVAGLSN